MTVQKALKGLQVMIAHDEKIVQGMNKYIVEWTNLDEKPDLATRAAIILRNFCLDDLKMLHAIQKQLNQDAKSNCSHPKKLRDIDPDGNLYCMECNQDL